MTLLEMKPRENVRRVMIGRITKRGGEVVRFQRVTAPSGTWDLHGKCFPEWAYELREKK